MNSKVEVRISDLLLALGLALQVWIALEIRGLKSLIETLRP